MSQDAVVSKPKRKSKIRYYVFIAWSLIAMLGYLINVDALKGLGLASQLSPLPVVFSDVKGFETFAASFELVTKFEDGTEFRREVDPKFYSEVQGPYNRRNVYGAAISYGPRLPEKTWKSILSYAICNNGPLAREVGFTKTVSEAVVLVDANTLGRPEHFDLAFSCAETRFGLDEAAL